METTTIRHDEAASVEIKHVSAGDAWIRGASLPGELQEAIVTQDDLTKYLEALADEDRDPRSIQLRLPSFIGGWRPRSGFTLVATHVVNPFVRFSRVDVLGWPAFIVSLKVGSAYAVIERGYHEYVIAEFQPVVEALKTA